MADRENILKQQDSGETSPDYLLDAFQAIPEIFGVYDKKNRLLDCNNSFEDFFGAPKKDLIGKKFNEITLRCFNKFIRIDGKFPPDSKEKFSRFCETLSKKYGKSFLAENKDGVIYQINHYKTKKGNLVFYAWDASPEIRASQRLEQAIEALPDLTTVTNDKGIYVACNSAFAKFIGKPRDFIIGKHRREVIAIAIEKWKTINGKPIKGSKTQLWKFLEEASRNQADIEYETVDGHFQAIYRQVPGIGGISISRNITALKRAELQLRAAVETIPDLVSMTDAQGRVFMVNTAFENYIGLPKEKIIGKTRGEIVGLSVKKIKKINGKPVVLTVPDYLKIFNKAAKEKRTLEIESNDGRIRQAIYRNIPGGGAISVARDITDIRKVEKELIEAIEAVPDLITISNGEGVIVACNSGVLDFVGKTREEIIGQPREKIAQMNAKKFKKLNGKPLNATGKELVDIFTEAAKTKNTIELETEGGVIREAAYHKIPGGGVISIARDITDIRRAEEELAKSERQLRHLVESIPLPIVVTRLEDETILFASPAAEKAIGTKSLLGRKTSEFYGEKETQAQKHEELKEKGFLHNYQGLVRRDDGTTFPALVSIEVFEYEGETASVLCLSDISEQKELENQLRNTQEDLKKSEHQLRNMVESNPMPVIVSRLSDSDILFASPAAEKTMAVDCLLGRKIPEFAVDPEKFKKAREILLKRGELLNYDTILKRGDGQTFPALVSVQTLEFEGSLAAIFGFLDITAQKDLESKFTEQREALYQSEKMNALGNLLAGVAHELNNPLSVVVGQALLLQETTKDLIAKKRAEKIRGAADRCAKIVKTFLAMARQKPPEAHNVDLNEVIKSAVDVTNFALRQNEISLEIDLPQDLPLIWGDGDQLGQVIMNFIINSQHALETQTRERKISITSWKNPEANEVCFSVKDNGPGISKDIQKRIFEPFYTTKEVGSGTGLGLSLAQSVVKAHFGVVEVNSEPGRGTEFVVRLPQTKKFCHPEKPFNEQETGTKSLKILIVDDEPEVLETLEEILIIDGHQVRLAASGKKALELLKQYPFDAIISDIRMPELDGPGLFEKIKHDFPELQTRIGFITGDTLSKTASDFLKNKKLPTFEKPFGPTEIRKLLKQLTK